MTERPDPLKYIENYCNHIQKISASITRPAMRKLLLLHVRSVQEVERHSWDTRYSQAIKFSESTRGKFWADVESNIDIFFTQKTMAHGNRQKTTR